MTKLIASYCILGYSMFGASIPVAVSGVTSTQAVISYTAPSAAPCNVVVKDASGALSNDTNEALFPGSSLDSRALSTGRARQFVAGAKTSSKATDGTMKSRALRADASYSGVVTCGLDSGVFAIRTATIPLGDSSPNPFPWDTNGFGRYGYPDVNTGASGYVDPQTGAWLRPIDLSGYAAPGIDTNALQYVYDLKGAWSNPSAMLSGGTSSYTGTGGTAATLFLPFHLSDGGRGWFFPGPVTGNDDAKIHLIAGSTLAGDSFFACLTVKGSDQCTGTPFTIAIQQGSPQDAFGPGPVASAFQSRFKGWGRVNLPEDQMVAPPGAIASISHSTISNITPSWGSTPFAFPSELAPGTHIHIAGSACPNSDCSVKSVQSATQLTINEDAGTLTSAPYSIENWGVLVWPSPSSTPRTITVTGGNVQFAHSADFYVGVDGGYRFCQGPDVQIGYEADGVTPIASGPVAGKVCMVQSYWNDAFKGGSRQYLIALRKDTGEVRMLNRLSLYGNSVDPADPYSVYEADASGNVGKCTYNPAVGHFASLPHDWNVNTMNPAMTCTGNVVSNFLGQIKAAYPQFDQTYYKVGFNGRNGKYVVFTGQNADQDGMSFGCVADTSKPAGSELIGCVDTWSRPGGRWMQTHGGGIMPLTDTGWLSFFGTYLGSSGSFGGSFRIAVTKVYNSRSTAISDTFVDPQTCETLGVSAQYQALGAKGSNCIRVNVPEEPLIPGKPPGDQMLNITGVSGGRPMAYRHNSPGCGGDGKTPAGLLALGAGWDCASYLQPLTEGDWVRDIADGADYNAERFLVAKKTPLADGTIDLVLSRHVSAGNWPADGTQAWCVGANTVHGVGGGPWYLGAEPVKGCGGEFFSVNAADPNFRTNPTWISDDPYAYGAHGALIYTPTNGFYSHWSVGSGNLGGNSGNPGYYGFGYGVASAHFPEAFATKFPAYSVNDAPPFHYATSGGMNVQAHPGVHVERDINGNPVVTAVDGRPEGAPHGGATSPFDQGVTAVSGTVFKLTSVDKTDLKRRAMLGWYGHTLLRDASGPNSAATFASTLDTFCFAYAAGECMAGSSAGDTFVSMLNPDTSGSCIVSMVSRTPCVSPVARHVFRYTQFGVSGADPMGMRERDLTSYFQTAGSQENYANHHGSDGAGMIGWARFVNGERSILIWLDTPRWQEDSINRTDYVQVPLQLSGRKGDQVGVRFGYDQNLFCTTRQEQCSTGAANGDAFAFATTDAVNWQACGLGCTVNIPAYANRVLYYVVDRKDASGRVVSALMQALAVP